MKEQLRVEGASVHQRAQVTTQVGRWPEGPHEDEPGHSDSESCRVCARVHACVTTGLCPAAPHVCCGLPGARGSCLRAHPCPEDGRPQGVLPPAGLRVRLAYRLSHDCHGLPLASVRGTRGSVLDSAN